MKPLESSGSSSGSSGGPVPGWVRVNDLAKDLGRSPRWARQWVADNVPEALQKRFPRPGGGSPELWVAPAAQDRLRAVWSSGSSSGSSSGTAADPGTQDQTTTAEATEGWRVAFEAFQTQAEAAAAEARRAVVRAETLEAELRALRVVLEAAQQRAEEAERGRHAAERLLDDLRARVWSWVALVQAQPWWRRLRRLPDPPAGLVHLDRRLEPPREPEAGGGDV